MKTLLTVLLFSAALWTQAQEIIGQDQGIKVTTTYYTKDNIKVEDKDRAHYYRIDSLASGRYGSYSYYISNGQLRQREAFLDEKLPRYEVMYYENGQKMWEGDCQYNFVVGKIDVWYNDGKKLAVLEFPREQQPIASERKYQIMQYWDPAGNQLVTDGSGTGEFNFPYIITENAKGSVVGGYKDGAWTGKHQFSQGTYEENFEAGKFINGVTTLDGKKYPYTKIEESAVPPGGLEKYYRFISSHMKYPGKARRMRQQGKVYVEFVVHKDGVVRDINVIKGIGAECDNEAARVVALSPKWEPGLQRGIPVKTRMVLPITFNLGR